MIQRLWRSRGLIWSLTVKDLKARYAGSFGGILWNVVQPLALVATFTFLFGHILRGRGLGGGKGYVFYLVAGLLPWNAMQEGVQRASGVLLENSRLIQRVPFPMESLVAQAVLTSTLSLAATMTVFLFFLPFLGVDYGLRILLLPLAIIFQTLFMFGPSLIVGGLTPFWRDLQPFTSLALFFGFWLTPIVYTTDAFPPEISMYFAFNPFHQIAGLYRAILGGGDFPGAAGIAGLLALTVLSLIVGARVFEKASRQAPELV